MGNLVQSAGVVHFSGHLTEPNALNADYAYGYLPAGFRPGAPFATIVEYNNANLTKIRIGSDGKITFIGSSVKGFNQDFNVTFIAV